MNNLPTASAVVVSPHPGLNGEGALPYCLPNFAGDGWAGIRRFRQEDVPQLFEAARESIQDLCRWMVWCHPGYSLEDCSRFVSHCDSQWERGESYSFAIFDARDGTFLGSAGLNQVNQVHRVANLGYWVRSSQAGRGIATCAVRMAARFGLQELGLNRLDLVVPVGNWPSRRVAEKVGAKQEGVLRNRLVLQGKAWDAILYSMVAEDLEAQGRELAAVSGNLI